MKRCFLILAVALLCAGCDPKFLKMQMWMWSENHKSLDFYGRIIDQDGRPVEGVKVIAGVGTYVSFTESGGTKYTTASDVEGRFSFTGIRGSGCGYLLEKPGYEFSQRQAFASRPKDYIPDPNKPALFSIWKLHGAESMYKTKIQVLIPCDGTPLVFDLTGHNAFGALKVSFKRDPVNIDRAKPFPWTLTLYMENGGFVKNEDVYPYQAPATGYRQAVTVSYDPTDKYRWASYNYSYYLFDGQRYGRITLDLTPDYQPPPTVLEVECEINPSGSRNLEIDPYKMLDHNLTHWRIGQPASAR